MDDIPDLVEQLPPDFAVEPQHLATVGTTVAPPVAHTRKIPLTIVTGYLGSGKSTLLEMVGKVSNKRLAIILNEFGDTAAIEKSVTIQDKGTDAVQQWLDLGNGCLCCTVKDNGVLAIENLIENSKEKIDYILLETTGVADPAPIAKMFWLDDALLLSVYIDGVVTVVDARNILTCLDDVGGHWHRQNSHVILALDADASPAEIQREAELLREGITTAHLQIALADCILLNKIDTVLGAKEQAALESRIRKINGSSPIYATQFGDIALDKILDLHAFDASAAKVALLVAVATSAAYHDDRILTVSLSFPFFSDAGGFEKVESFLQCVLWENVADGQPVEVHRVKGILAYGDDVRVIQGVRDTYDVIENAVLPASIACNKIVFIGKALKHAALEKQLWEFLEGSQDARKMGSLVDANMDLSPSEGELVRGQDYS